MRAIVSVAFGSEHYRKGQQRLAEKLCKIDPQTQRFFWDFLPGSWPPHNEIPYAFKAYALAEAAKRADLLLWMDAVISPVKSLEPIWKCIEKTGYWMISPMDHNNYEWTADSAYADLFPGMKIELAREINKTILHMWDTAFGINARTVRGIAFLDEYLRLTKTKAFCGPRVNEDCTVLPYGCQQGPEHTAPCGPADVLGHRHCETVMSKLAWDLGWKPSECTPGALQHVVPGDPNQEKAILFSDGGFKI